MKHDLASLVALSADTAASSDAVADGLSAAQRLAEAAATALSQAETAYRDSLLTADDKAMGRLASERGTAEIRRDRVAQLVVALDERLTAARASEDAARKRDAYAAARTLRDAAVERVEREYPALAQEALALLRVIAEADLAVARSNDDLPEGAERLSRVEIIARAHPGAAREVLDERTVELWCPEGSAEPIPAERQARVIRQDDRRGYSSTPHGQSFFERRAFHQTTALPAVRAQYSDPLASALVLPPLRPGEPLAWALDDHDPHPDQILRRLDAIAAASAVSRPAPKRVPEIKHEPVAG
ncbi:hypothetical protein [Methylobacterium aquaticum]|uniref:hypothetical protein n=1 Tax=Methylobacterium aquaticum TaxID=270351 RepID=UPI001933B019|nr:hypothetical protein [Methylobacterium aquaticum]QRE78239.1 hypothetical protein F1D61_32960 [Methylobacterium aquaticum]QRE78258.1 hypothetical protein F1D61_33065 [Methylobacterium aquaticum]